MRRGILAGLAASLVLLAGCSAPPANPADDLSFEVMQGRTDYASGTLVLRVVNGGTESITVDDAVLTWEGFAEPAHWSGTTITAGRTVDLRTAAPGAKCTTGKADPPAPSLAVEFGTGPAVVTTPLDPLDTLQRLHQTGCVSAAVERVATVSVDGPLVIDGTGPDAVARLTLLFTPTRGEGTVQFSSVASTPLLAPADGSEGWPLSLALAGASAPQSAVLSIRPARCDPHAVAEDKIGTVLVVTVSVDGADGRYSFPVDDATRDALYGFVRSACGMP
ncbi:hypothetical protein [Mycetocola zhujimingii]|uniref:hypothetical protein n=1 Tax=Mycetocola zhujimingii TaxID=2079792 RepID=UPI000D35DF81|nr:hypothetical protein [Mycetocola zhujimingii]AWB86871.1 hypothetical protein C3E77_09765 [Mycetocola zhujimingii]